MQIYWMAGKAYTVRVSSSSTLVETVHYMWSTNYWPFKSPLNLGGVLLFFSRWLLWVFVLLFMATCFSFILNYDDCCYHNFLPFDDILHDNMALLYCVCWDGLIRYFTWWDNLNRYFTWWDKLIRYFTH